MFRQFKPLSGLIKFDLKKLFRSIKYCLILAQKNIQGLDKTFKVAFKDLEGYNKEQPSMFIFVALKVRLKPPRLQTKTLEVTKQATFDVLFRNVEVLMEENCAKNKN